MRGDSGVDHRVVDLLALDPMVSAPSQDPDSLAVARGGPGDLRSRRDSRHLAALDRADAERRTGRRSARSASSSASSRTSSSRSRSPWSVLSSLPSGPNGDRAKENGRSEPAIVQPATCRGRVRRVTRWKERWPRGSLVFGTIWRRSRHRDAAGAQPRRRTRRKALVRAIEAVRSTDPGRVESPSRIWAKAGAGSPPSCTGQGRSRSSSTVSCCCCATGG